MKKSSYILPRLFLLITLQGCLSSRSFDVSNSLQGEKINQICDLAEMNFDIEDTFFKKYSEYYDFNKSNYEVDIIHLYSKSGSNFSYLSRLTLLNSDTTRFFFQSENIYIDTLITNWNNEKVLKDKIDKMEGGSYINVCFQDRSSPFYHTYFIKKKDKIYFKYHLNTSNYNQLKPVEARKIYNTITVLSLLQDLENKSGIKY